MPLAKRGPCSRPRCPHLKPCPDHASDRELDRGTFRQRGYDAQHDAEAASAKDAAMRERRLCPRCARPMLPGQALDYGHSSDRARAPGARADRVEHAACNRAAGGAAGRTLNRRPGG